MDPVSAVLAALAAGAMAACQGNRWHRYQGCL